MWKLKQFIDGWMWEVDGILTLISVTSTLVIIYEIWKLGHL